MNATKIAGIALIIAGVLGLVYGGFTYPKETHRASVGPVDMSITERGSFNIPMWAGVGAILIGGGLLVLGGRGR
ncbi:MAG TPA: hypothetical protein PLN31_09060 [Azoarcus taiwanensis]|nr:hypothetical protein [Azoarcus taiwanensis]